MFKAILTAAILFATAAIAEPECKPIDEGMVRVKGWAEQIGGSAERLTGENAALFLLVWNTMPPVSSQEALSVVIMTSPRDNSAYIIFEQECGLPNEAHKMELGFWTETRRRIMGML